MHSSNAHAQPSNGDRRLIFGRTLRLLPYFMCANNECSSETAHLDCPEPSVVAYVISTIISWAGSILMFGLIYYRYTFGPRQANLVLIAYASSEGSGEPAHPMNGWACAVKICHDGMLEDTNSLDAARLSLQISALLMIAFGAWSFQERNKYYYQEITTIYEFFLDLSIILMVVGSIMFLITFCGFVGSLRENTLLLRIVSTIIDLIYLKPKVTCQRISLHFFCVLLSDKQNLFYSCLGPINWSYNNCILGNNKALYQFARDTNQILRYAFILLGYYSFNTARC